MAVLVPGDTGANGDVGPFRWTQISFPVGKPWPNTLIPLLQSQAFEMPRVLPAPEGWACCQANTPGALGATLELICHPTPLPGPAMPLREDRDAALRPRISPAPGLAPVQGTVLKAGNKAETDAWRSPIPGWGSQQWVP